MLNDYWCIGTNKEVVQAVESATKDLSNPKFMVFASNYENFEEATRLLHEKYPECMIMGMSGYAYSKTETVTEYVAVWAVKEGVTVHCDVIEDLDQYPIKHIKKIEHSVEMVKPGRDNTVCLSFMTNGQDCLTTTMNSVLLKNHIELWGATPLRGLQYENPIGDKVSLNGKIYMNSCVYAVIKNNSGKAKVYKENIYCPIGQRMRITKMNKDTGEIMELNGKPALKEYQRVVGEIKGEDAKNIVGNSICRIVGNEEYTFVLEVQANKITCLKQLACNDVISVAGMGDYEAINQETIKKIKGDFTHITTIFTLDCIFRNLAFNERNYTKNYLSNVQSLGRHVGLITGGETYKLQSVHQTMVCAVFE